VNGWGGRRKWVIAECEEKSILFVSIEVKHQCEGRMEAKGKIGTTRISVFKKIAAREHLIPKTEAEGQDKQAPLTKEIEPGRVWV